MTSPYLKFFSQLVATVLAALIPALTNDQTLGVDEIINVVIIGLGAIAVLGAGNLPSGVWALAKFWVSAATAVAVLLASVYTDGITMSEWIQLAMAALGALGVVAVPGPRVAPTTARATRPAV
jgi:hypothetical protein